MNKLFKKLLLMLLLLLSPMVMLAVLGTIYIAVRLLGGLEITAAFSSFKTVLHTLIPYFPYLTMIPAVLFILAHFARIKIKFENSRTLELILRKIIRIT